MPTSIGGRWQPGAIIILKIIQKDSEAEPDSPGASAGVTEQHLAPVRAEGTLHEHQAIGHSSDGLSVPDGAAAVIWLKSRISC